MSEYDILVEITAEEMKQAADDIERRRKEAADTIEALRAENAKLLKALNGLIDVAKYCDGINTSEQLRAACAARGESDE